MMPCTNKWLFRCSGQAQLLAIAQSIPSALLVFTACAIPVGAYGVLREDWSSGLFSAAAFVLLSLELTMVSSDCSISCSIVYRMLVALALAVNQLIKLIV